MTYRRKALHLCEHDSTVSVNMNHVSHHFQSHVVRAESSEPSETHFSFWLIPKNNRKPTVRLYSFQFERKMGPFSQR